MCIDDAQKHAWQVGEDTTVIVFDSWNILSSSHLNRKILVVRCMLCAGKKMFATVTLPVFTKVIKLLFK